MKEHKPLETCKINEQTSPYIHILRKIHADAMNKTKERPKNKQKTKTKNDNQKQLTNKKQ